MSNAPNAAPVGRGDVQQPSVWDHRDCTGVEGCPPRCPRFIDDTGTALRITRGAGSRREDLVDFYDEYPPRHRSMSLPPLTRPQVESWVDKIVDRGESFLAFHQGTLVGHVAYMPTDHEEPELIVFVADEYQNRGLGTELCKQVMAHGADDGYPALRLHVSADNDSALAVYRSLGFVEVQREGKQIEMRVVLDEDLTEQVQAPPAER